MLYIPYQYNLHESNIINLLFGDSVYDQADIHWIQSGNGFSVIIDQIGKPLIIVRYNYSRYVLDGESGDSYSISVI